MVDCDVAQNTTSAVPRPAQKARALRSGGAMEVTAAGAQVHAPALKRPMCAQGCTDSNLLGGLPGVANGPLQSARAPHALDQGPVMQALLHQSAQTLLLYHQKMKVELDNEEIQAKYMRAYNRTYEAAIEQHTSALPLDAEVCVSVQCRS
jgi:hypothetical protein